VDQVDPHSLCRQFRKWQLHSQCLPHLLLPVAGSGQEVSESIRDKRSRCLSLTRFFCDPLGFYRTSTSEGVACVTL